MEENKEKLIKYKGELMNCINVYFLDTCEHITKKDYDSAAAQLEDISRSFLRAGLSELESITKNYAKELGSKEPDKGKIKEYDSDVTKGLKSLKEKLNNLKNESNPHAVGGLLRLREDMQKKPF